MRLTTLATLVATTALLLTSLGQANATGQTTNKSYSTKNWAIRGVGAYFLTKNDTVRAKLGALNTSRVTMIRKLGTTKAGAERWLVGTRTTVTSHSIKVPYATTQVTVKNTKLRGWVGYTGGHGSVKIAK